MTAEEKEQRLRQHAAQLHAALAAEREQHVRAANALAMQMAEIEKTLADGATGPPTEDPDGNDGS